MDFSSTLVAWTILAVVATLSPGPDTLLVAGHAARSGLRAGLLATAGIVAGGVWYMLLGGFGLLSVLVASPLVFSVVKIAGAAYLLYLGLTLLRGSIAADSLQTHTHVVLLSTPFRQALVTNALNPKVALFYLAVLPQFVGNGPDAPIKAMLLIFIHYLSAGIWFSIVSVVASKAGGAARKTSLWRWIEGGLGLAFCGLAGKLAFERQ